MSSIGACMDHPEWTHEQRVAVMKLERLLLKRKDQEQGLVPWYAANPLSTLATTPDPLPVVRTPAPVVASTSSGAMA